MKETDLKQRFRELESKYPLYKGNNTDMFNLQYETNKLYIEIISDYNKKAEIYNSRLLFYTIVIAILTLAMVFPLVKSFFLWILTLKG